MQQEEIRTRIMRILCEELHAPGPLRDTTALLGDNVLDSMDFANFLTRLEEEFDVTISNDDVATAHLGVIGNLVMYLAERVKKQDTENIP